MTTDPDTPLLVVAVAVIVRREETFLAMRRALTKDAGPGLWEALSRRGNTLGGRRARSQGRVRPRVQLEPRPVTSYPATRLGLPMIVIVYRADYSGGEVTLSDEHGRYRWLTPDDFAETSTLTPLIYAARLAFKV